MGANTQLLCVNAVSESTLSKFWGLESIGVTSKEELTENCNYVQQKFDEHVKFVDGRFVVALPWKSESAGSQLQDNVKMAEKRLSNLCHRFQKDPHLREEYDAVLRMYEKEGICEEVPPSQLKSIHPTYYLPHHPVVRESSSSTKIRPVFDASAACSLLQTSNSKDMVEYFSNKICLDDKEAFKVLGMQWKLDKDSFSFTGLNAETPLELISTKRAVLSCIARLFDLLGFLSPFIMYIKIVSQEIWKEGIEWDEVLPDQLLYKFQRWFNSISQFKTWCIRRCYFPGVSWRLMNGAELHAFGDASEKG